MVFMKKHIHLLCSMRKSRLFESLKKAVKYAVSAQLMIHVRKTENSDNYDDGSGIMNAFHDNRSHPFVVGHIPKEAEEGDKVSEKLCEKLGIDGFQIVDISAGLSDLFAVKEEDELVCMKRAAYLSAKLMKNVVVAKLLKAIDHKENKKDVHKILIEEIEEATLQPALKLNVKLRSQNVDICRHPDLKRYCSNDELTYSDSASVITCSLGSQYKGYCSNVARSFLVSPDSSQIKAYEILLKAQEAAISAVRPGVRVGAAYVAASSIIRSEAPELVGQLTESVGAGIGLEFHESVLDLIGTNDRMVKAGMAFNVSLALRDLKGADNSSFSLLLADTVVVCAEGAEVLTQPSPKAVGYVTYPFKHNHDNGEGRAKKNERGPWIVSQKVEVPALEKNEETAALEKLQLLDRPIRLPGLRIGQPVFGGRGRKLLGALEAHVNGFRYSYPWQEDEDGDYVDEAKVDADDASAEMRSSAEYVNVSLFQGYSLQGDDSDGRVDDILFDNIENAFSCVCGL
ncbi:unnamed protein product [Linum trigynum]|uniref:FACT complex subunit n=1 Tax=Linum trigynum TaxID=586398 RepID=A0AAV2F787_9ROSI